MRDPLLDALQTLQEHMRWTKWPATRSAWGLLISWIAAFWEPLWRTCKATEWHSSFRKSQIQARVACLQISKWHSSSNRHTLFCCCLPFGMPTLSEVDTNSTSWASLCALALIRAWRLESGFDPYIATEWRCCDETSNEAAADSVWTVIQNGKSTCLRRMCVLVGVIWGRIADSEGANWGKAGKHAQLPKQVVVTMPTSISEFPTVPYSRRFSWRYFQLLL